jgi:VWFA-related protein
MRLFRGIAIAVALFALMQQTGPIAAQDGGVTFRSTTRLVVVNVSVKDKQGNLVSGMKPSDFELSEDGKPQQIKVFEYQQLDDTVLPPESFASRSPTLPDPGAVVEAAVSTPISPAQPGEIKYRNRRLLVLYFDESGMPVADQIRSQQAALHFLSSQMTESDLIAVMTYSTDLKVLQDFTGDRDLLTNALKKLTVGDTGMSNGSTGADNETDTGAAYTADDSEFNIFNTDRKLASLENAVRMLGGLTEKKALVYFASGMTRTGIDNQAQIRATINAAVRGNVAFYPVDTRGLDATPPLGDATTGSPGGQGMYSGSSQRAAQSSFQDQQETLYTLAADTGGKALLDYNDLSLGIVQAQKGIGNYYVLGYYSTNPALDGHYRRIKVRMPGNPTAKLDFRSGYFAPKTFRRFNSSDRERQLQEAIELGDPVTDLSLALEVDYFREARDRYFVPVSVRIPGNDIELAKKSGAESTRIDFIGQVKDARGALQGTVRDEITIKLKGENAGQLASRNLEYDTGFSLPPGAYSLKFLARENETGKIGTFETKFTVPDLTASQRYLPVSSVVLGYQREKLSAALASAERDKKLIAGNPLVHDGQKLMPSVTHVFRSNQNMYVYMEAYQPSAATTEPMVAVAGFYRGKIKAFETAPVRIDSGLNSRSKAVPITFSIPLAKLPAGRYTFQVSVVNPAESRFAVWRSPVVLLPAVAP